jgi:hypothetical protein
MLALGDLDAKVRPDAGRLTGGYRNPMNDGLIHPDRPA